MESQRYEAPFQISTRNEQSSVVCQVLCAPGSEPSVPLAMDITSEQDRLLYFRVEFTSKGIHLMNQQLQQSLMSPEILQKHIHDLFTQPNKNRKFCIIRSADDEQDYFNVFDRQEGIAGQVFTLLQYQAQRMSAEVVQQHLAELLDAEVLEAKRLREQKERLGADFVEKVKSLELQLCQEREERAAEREAARKADEGLKSRLEVVSAEAQRLSSQLLLAQNEKQHYSANGEQTAQSLKSALAELQGTRQQKQAVETQLQEARLQLTSTREREQAHSDEARRLSVLAEKLKSDLSETAQGKRDAEVRLQAASKEADGLKQQLGEAQKALSATQQAFQEKTQKLELGLQEQRQLAALTRQKYEETAEKLRLAEKKADEYNAVSTRALDKAEEYMDKLQTLQQDLQVTQDELRIQSQLAETLKKQLTEADENKISAEAQLECLKAEAKELRERAEQAEKTLGKQIQQRFERGDLGDFERFKQLSGVPEARPPRQDRPKPASGKSSVDSSVLSEYAHLFKDSQIPQNLSQPPRPKASQISDLSACLKPSGKFQVVSLAQYMQPIPASIRKSKEAPEAEPSSASSDTKALVSRYMRGKEPELENIFASPSRSASSDIVFDQIKAIESASRLADTLAQSGKEARQKPLVDSFVPFGVQSGAKQGTQDSIAQKYLRYGEMSLDTL